MRGVGVKEQREYEHIKESAERSGRYGKRAKEVAARTVMKQHKAKGHTPDSNRRGKFAELPSRAIKPRSRGCQQKRFVNGI